MSSDSKERCPGCRTILLPVLARDGVVYISCAAHCGYKLSLDELATGKGK